MYGITTNILYKCSVCQELFNIFSRLSTKFNHVKGISLPSPVEEPPLACVRGCGRGVK